MSERRARLKRHSAPSPRTFPSLLSAASAASAVTNDDEDYKKVVAPSCISVSATSEFLRDEMRQENEFNAALRLSSSWINLSLTCASDVAQSSPTFSSCRACSPTQSSLSSSTDLLHKQNCKPVNKRRRLESPPVPPPLLIQLAPCSPSPFALLTSSSPTSLSSSGSSLSTASSAAFSPPPISHHHSPLSIVNVPFTCPLSATNAAPPRIVSPDISASPTPFSSQASSSSSFCPFISNRKSFSFNGRQHRPRNNSVNQSSSCSSPLSLSLVTSSECESDGNDDNNNKNFSHDIINENYVDAVKHFELMPLEQNTRNCSHDLA